MPSSAHLYHHPTQHFAAAWGPHDNPSRGQDPPPRPPSPSHGPVKHICPEGDNSTSPGISRSPLPRGGPGTLQERGPTPGPGHDPPQSGTWEGVAGCVEKRFLFGPKRVTRGPGSDPKKGCSDPEPFQAAERSREELVCFHKQRRVAATADTGDDAHLEGVVDIRVGKRVTVEIRHLSRARRHPPDPGAEREMRRGRRPPARSRRRSRRRADPGAASQDTQPAAPLSMPGATGAGPAALIPFADPFLWAWIQPSGLWLSPNRD